MPGHLGKGRNWYNEVAQRPKGYRVHWNYWVEGPDAQAIFDRMVLASVPSHPDVLDCGCGDGAFTVQVARIARQVIALDYAERMLERAGETVEAAGLTNVTFIRSHIRRDNPLPNECVDLAYTRRGPRIHVDSVPKLVRRGGLLMGIHPPLDYDVEQFREEVREVGLDLQFCEEFDDRYHFPTLRDFAAYMSRQPGMPDLREPAKREVLMDLARRHQTGDGDYVVPVRYLVWAAVRSHLQIES